MGTFDSVYKNKIRQLEEENRQLRKILKEASATSSTSPTSPAAPPGQMTPEPMQGPSGYNTDPYENLSPYLYPIQSPRPPHFQPKPTWATPMAPRLPDRVRGRGYPYPGSGAYPQLPAYYD